jgi:hypothetical protein
MPSIVMKTKPHKVEFDLSEILVLHDGKILAHNITPAMARLLSELNPRDRAMRRRANSNPISKHEFPG